jgi:hypothetical protein
MSKVEPSEQREALLTVEWLKYCEGERRGEYQPLDFETWKERQYGKELHKGRD